jgi:DNA mismatch endonuclease, patch repair protein
MGRAPRYHGLVPSSPRASVAARGSSRKADTKPELLLRVALRKEGLRYRKNRRDLPGIPDIVFASARLVVFVDGDFWHGKDWKKRKMKLSGGHNANYWVRKIEMNISRDREQNQKLCHEGWTVLRVWESEIRSNLDGIVSQVKAALGKSNTH